MRFFLGSITCSDTFKIPMADDTLALRAEIQRLQDTISNLSESRDADRAKLEELEHTLNQALFPGIQVKLAQVFNSDNVRNVRDSVVESSRSILSSISSVTAPLMDHFRDAVRSMLFCHFLGQ